MLVWQSCKFFSKVNAGEEGRQQVSEVKNEWKEKVSMFNI